VAPIRVVLGTMPTLLGDIVRETLACHPDFEVLAEVAERGEISPAVQRTGADVAVVAIKPRDRPSDRRSLPGELLAAHPQLRLIALTSDGRTGYVYELEPREDAIVEISPQLLLDAIRGWRARRP
jgi:hypothetical protein